jgi:dephospho-CoA kinase
MVWIGGNPGSGKSTIARMLACELDLPLHPVDAYTYDHVDRLGGFGAPLDAELARGAAAAADAFERVSALRLPLVVEDVRAARVGEVPTLVEGPQLHPDAVAAWAPVASIWLVTTAERTRAAREERLVDPDEAARKQVDLLVERDRVLGARLGAAAARRGLPVVQVPTDVRWEGVTATVRAVILRAISERPRLRPGAELAARRRHENDVVHRQIAAHERHTGAALPPFPYACTCGRSGCDDVEPATTADYR